MLTRQSLAQELGNVVEDTESAEFSCSITQALALSGLPEACLQLSQYSQFTPLSPVYYGGSLSRGHRCG